MFNNTVLNKYEERVEAVTEYLPPLEERYRIIEEINEDFFKEHGENLPAYLLDKLGSWVLREVYADKRVNKIQLEEYPVLTSFQMGRRARREVLVQEEKTISNLGFHSKNNSLWLSKKEVDLHE